MARMTRAEFDALPPARMAVGERVLIWKGEGRPVETGVIERLDGATGEAHLTYSNDAGTFGAVKTARNIRANG